ERGQHAALDSGLLGDLADGRLLGGLALFDVALGQRPQHAPAPVHATDQRRDLSVLRSVDAVDDQSAGRGLVDRAQPVGCTTAWLALGGCRGTLATGVGAVTGSRAG